MKKERLQKLPFRVSIKILQEFMIFEIGSVDDNNNTFQISSKFDCFGYFKHDFTRKVFCLYRNFQVNQIDLHPHAQNVVPVPYAMTMEFNSFSFYPLQREFLNHCGSDLRVLKNIILDEQIVKVLPDSLRELTFECEGFTEEYFERISRLERLEKLSFYVSLFFRDNNRKRFEFSNLRELSVFNNIGGLSWFDFASLKNLRELLVYDNKIYNGDFTFVRKLPNIQKVKFLRCDLEDKFIDLFGSEKIIELDLSECKCDVLMLFGVKFSFWSKLRTIFLRRILEIPPQFFIQLGTLKTIEHVFLEWCKLNDEFLESILKSKRKWNHLTFHTKVFEISKLKEKLLDKVTDLENVKIVY